jgi:5-formyltetrahydrofolate cyclo-ligase
MELRQAKQVLRRQVAAWRDTLSAAEREAASTRLTARVLALDCYRRADTVLLYFAVGSEPATAGLVGAVLKDGKRLVLPRIADGDLVLHRVTDPAADLKEGVWGIREPLPDLPRVGPAEVDLFLLPGLAFDAGGGRLGYGRGYFDRTLAGTRGVKAALAFDGQVVERVPRGPADVAVDLVVTPTRLIRCGADGAGGDGQA